MHTVIAEQELFRNPEHPLRLARLRTLDQLFKTRFVTQRDGDALKAAGNCQHQLFFYVTESTHSVKSMISKPLVQRIAILAFKKMRSKDSEGKKKS
jgi:hypothetical protein